MDLDSAMNGYSSVRLDTPEIELNAFLPYYRFVLLKIFASRENVASLSGRKGKRRTIPRLKLCRSLQRTTSYSSATMFDKPLTCVGRLWTGQAQVAKPVTVAEAKHQLITRVRLSSSLRFHVYVQRDNYDNLHGILFLTRCRS